MGAHNVWVYCFESGELLCMPTAQRSQCRYFAYQLWKERGREREETGCLDSQGGKDKKQRRWNTGGSGGLFSPRTGGKQNIDTSAEAQGQVDTSYYRAGFDKLRTPPPTKAETWRA